jgi:membrane-bound inhibitor of C-type lysozyme
MLAPPFVVTTSKPNFLSQMLLHIFNLVISFALLSCAENNLLRLKQADEAQKESGVAESRLVLDCDNGYDISAIYYAPDSEGVVLKLSLKISQAGKTDTVEMIPAIAASGAKFETTDGQWTFWEHQGEFTLGTGDNHVSVCRQVTKKTVP